MADPLETVEAALSKVDEESSLTASGDDWPTLDNDALYGLAGDVVRAIEPHTEADPVALLVDFLTSFGNCVGPGPFAFGDGRKHPPRLSVVLVGATSKSRKGTSRARIAPLFERVDPRWASERVMGGLASGEGLVEAVRDADDNDDPHDVGDPKRTDHGIRDKRLMVVEEEFSRVLIVTGRKDSTLSQIIRQAWDSGDLRVMTRRDPIRTSGAYISLLGHITIDELRRRLDEIEIANGFANRLLFFAVRRSKLLPHGGHVDEADLSRITRISRKRVLGARTVKELTWSPAASDLWDAYYEVMAEDVGGLVGSLTARSEAHVLRLSVAYALTDASSTIEEAHLNAAWALWQYARQSVELVFGDTSGDPVRDQLLAGITERGEMSHAQQYDHFGRNVRRHVLDRVRTSLLFEGLLGERSVKTGGRPSKVNFLLPRTRLRDIRGKDGEA